jgi:hypothetical protein
MNTAKINHVAVIVAGIAFYVWSAIWFIALGNQWQAFTGITTPAAPAAYIVSFVVSIVLAYVVGIALADSDNPNMVRHGIEFGIFMSVGIWATNLLSITMFERRPLGLWVIDALHVVIGMAIMGAIIGAWRKRA